jgi:hypothetical protein
MEILIFCRNMNAIQFDLCVEHISIIAFTGCMYPKTCTMFYLIFLWNCIEKFDGMLLLHQVVGCWIFKN